MASLFSKPKTPSVPVAVTNTDAAVEAAAKAETDKLRKRKGFMSTWLTGPQTTGGDTTGTNTGLKTLLGG